MIEALTVDAVSTIRLLEFIEGLYPMLVLNHVFLDNARYHHAKLVREWLARPGRRIKLQWAVMHKNVTHNKCYATCGQFADATLDLLRDKVPKNWKCLRDSVTDNFRVICQKDFRVVTWTGYIQIERNDTFLHCGCLQGRPEPLLLARSHSTPQSRERSTRLLD